MSFKTSQFIPFSWSFKRRPLHYTISKVFELSRKTAYIYIITLIISCVADINCIIQETPGLNCD